MDIFQLIKQLKEISSSLYNFSGLNNEGKLAVHVGGKLVFERNGKIYRIEDKNHAATKLAVEEYSRIIGLNIFGTEVLDKENSNNLLVTTFQEKGIPFSFSSDDEALRFFIECYPQDEKTIRSFFDTFQILWYGVNDNCTKYGNKIFITDFVANADLVIKKEYATLMAGGRRIYEWRK